MALTIEELREQIAKYGPLVGTSAEDNFSYNIVSMCLARIARDYGVAEANEAIKDLGLESRGFKPHGNRESSDA